MSGKVKLKSIDLVRFMDRCTYQHYADRVAVDGFSAARVASFAQRDAMIVRGKLPTLLHHLMSKTLTTTGMHPQS